MTIPNGGTSPHEGDTLHGNDSLVTSTGGIGGKIVVPPHFVGEDGSIDWMMGVRRIVPGEIIATGQRLDAPSPPAQGYYGMEGYGTTGFQPGGIHFPGEGCWEITVQVGDTTPLTFVTLVVTSTFDPGQTGWRIQWLPEGVRKVDMDVTNLPHAIEEIYRFPNGEEGEIIIETAQGEQEDPSPYPKAARQPVTILGLPGICVQGTWNDQGQWQADVDAGVLEWTSRRGFSYRISHTGLGLSCEDLLRIAGAQS